MLIVDDEVRHCRSLSEYFAGEHSVEVAGSAERALEILRTGGVDLILLDIRLPGMDGLSAIERFRCDAPSAPIIIMTAFGTIETAAEALRAGVFEYLVKPFPLNDLNDVIARALGAGHELRTASSDTPSLRDEPVIGVSPIMQRIFNRIAMAAASDVPVLLTGESGTGKEVLARAIHRHSARREARFLPVFLAALSPGLIESELFGHAKGAFTGAEIARAGFLEQASGGTVLLDELGDIPLPLQVKLLRALEQREITRVGEDRPRPVDIRYIAATNKPLRDLVARGEFREDLFYRLSVFHVEVPPLRERREDIRPLAEHFLHRMSAASRAPGISEAAFLALESRPWYGNIRELRNSIEHASIMSRGTVISEAHFPPPADSVPRIGNLSFRDRMDSILREWVDQQFETVNPLVDKRDLHSQLLGELEPRLFDLVLKRCQNNLAAASRILGLDPKTIRSRIASPRES
jgi:two-component system nitrogen regulation response regulator GlnG